ncbi:hemin ABC transporter substrate-binding protein [Olivibacter ginsenosidimutans]|uniref:Hemin ABC transporter substrate-binding protein n=1 Tax=Olivibacter ginsenosidimutans TaxID=1176537 RepID=A0ABP9AQA6_9SPHI
MNKKLSVFIIGLALIIVSCRNSDRAADESIVNDSTRIVSINGTISEILSGIGLENHIVGVDVASTYPKSLLQKPKVGHNRQMAAEGILALKPDWVIGVREEVKGELEDQLKAAGVKVLLFHQEYSIDGTKQLILAVSDSLGLKQKGDSILAKLDQDLTALDSLPANTEKPKVLFIYARGAGTMMVAGENTQPAKIIELADGQNAVSGFQDFKPLTSEALVAANPDVILLFTSGLESLGGPKGLLEVQGVKETNAGKNNKFVEMDGQLLTGFSQRLGQAIKELSEKIR